MEWHDGLYGFVRQVGKEGCTRSSVARYQRGCFVDRLDTFVQHGIIEIVPARDSRDDRIMLTSLGLKIFNHKLTVNELLKQETG